MRQVLIALAAAGALAGCSSSDDGPSAPPPPGCAQGYGTCFTAPMLTPASCLAMYGTYLPAGCPSDGSLVGICAEPYQTTYYYSPYYTPATGAYSCSGTYTPIIGPPATAWCDLRAVPGVAICSDLTGPQADLAIYASACSYYGGSWYTVGACPAIGRTGTCSYANGTVSFADRYYNPATAGADAAACISGGDTWTPG